MLRTAMHNSVTELHEKFLHTLLQRRISDNSVTFSIQLDTPLFNWALSHFIWAQNKFLKMIYPLLLGPALDPRAVHNFQEDFHAYITNTFKCSPAAGNCSICLNTKSDQKAPRGSSARIQTTITILNES